MAFGPSTWRRMERRGIDIMQYRAMAFPVEMYDVLATKPSNDCDDNEIPRSNRGRRARLLPTGGRRAVGQRPGGEHAGDGPEPVCRDQPDSGDRQPRASAEAPRGGREGRRLRRAAVRPTPADSRGFDDTAGESPVSAGVEDAMGV